MELQRYKCHKEVGAVKITSLTQNDDGTLTITGEGLDDAIVVEKKFVPTHDPARPQVGWYFVAYLDGYQSFSPAEAFEEGYTKTEGTVSI